MTQQNTKLRTEDIFDGVILGGGECLSRNSLFFSGMKKRIGDEITDDEVDVL